MKKITQNLIIDFLFSLLVTVGLFSLYGLIGFNTSNDTLLALIIILLGTMFGTVIGMLKSIYKRLNEIEEKITKTNEKDKNDDKGNE